MQVLRWTHVAAAAFMAATLSAGPGVGQIARAEDSAPVKTPSSRRAAPTKHIPATPDDSSVDERSNPLRADKPRASQSSAPVTKFSRAQARPAAEQAPRPSERPAARQATAEVSPRTAHRVARAVQEEALAPPAVPSDEQPEIVRPPQPSGEMVYEGEMGGYADGSCGPECCEPCGNCCALCGPPGRFWVNADYLVWWTKDSRFPPLITASPLSTPVSQTGVLGQPGTSIVFGDERHGSGSLNGGRIRFGMWLDSCHRLGVEGDYFALNDDNYSRTFACDETTALARPFFNVITGLQDSELVCYEGIVEGTATVTTSSSFQGAGGRVRMNAVCDTFCTSCDAMTRGPGLGGMCDTCWTSQSYNRVDFLGGYRFYRLDDSIAIREDLVSTNTGGVIPLGTTFVVIDDFRARNEFHGGEIGLHLDTRRGRWGWDVLGNLALGNNRQTVDIQGFTVTQVPGLDAIGTQAGLLAQGTNIGHYESDDFVVIPQIGANMSYYLTENLKLQVGYTLIYWDRVVRAAEIIDPNINPTQIPPGTLVGDPVPQFEFNDTSYWAQGFNVGAELRF